GCIFNA
ncbi:ubiA prenyltransferase family protein, partial [Vibrio parahaemolyticus V-223/04]